MNLSLYLIKAFIKLVFISSFIFSGAEVQFLFTVWFSGIKSNFLLMIAAYNAAWESVVEFNI